MEEQQLHELLYQALETELGGAEVYETALRCVKDDGLREEWERYAAQTRRHIEIVQEVMRAFGLDPSTETPGRKVVHHLGTSLVKAMTMALEEGTPDDAQLVATECVTLAETKDHQNWELLGLAADRLSGEQKKVLQEAHSEVQDQEDEHLYHTAGWSRELWIKALGMRAVLPPPEEEKNVKTAIGAARAQHAAGR